LHRLGEKTTDLGFAIGGDGADLRNLVVLGDLACLCLQFGDNGVYGLVDAALQVHWVHASGNCLGAFPDNRLGENGCGRGAVASQIIGLGGNFAHHLRAHVLELVLKLDFFGDGYAVLGDARCAEGLVDDDVAALGAQRNLHRIGEDIDATQHALTGIRMKLHFLCSHWITPFYRQLSLTGGVRSRQAAFFALAGASITPMTSLSFMMRRSSPSSLISVPDHLPNRMRSPTLTSSSTSLPASSRAPGPTAMTSPSLGFSLAVSGMMMPPAVFSSASMRRTRMRSCSGRNVISFSLRTNND